MLTSTVGCPPAAAVSCHGPASCRPCRGVGCRPHCRACISRVRPQHARTLGGWHHTRWTPQRVCYAACARLHGRTGNVPSMAMQGALFLLAGSCEAFSLATPRFAARGRPGFSRSPLSLVSAREPPCSPRSRASAATTAAVAIDAPAHAAHETYQ